MKQNIELEKGKTYNMSYVHPVAMTGRTRKNQVTYKE